MPVKALIGKAVEALSFGYSAGDFIYSVTTADSRDLLDEVSPRLLAREAGEGRDRPAAETEAPEEGADNLRQFPRPLAARTRCPA